MMRRNVQKTRSDWHPFEKVNGKFHKFNKNVSEKERKGFRVKTFKENVDLIVT